MHKIAALACGLAFGCGLPEVQSIDEGIIGGAPDLAHENVIAVDLLGGGYCSGTLISRRVVLTAGHCGDPYEHQPDYIVLGSALGKPAGTVAVDRAVRDPRYSIERDPNTVHDVALLHIVGDIPAQPAPLLRETMQNTADYIGPDYTFVGFGDTGVNPHPTGFGTRMAVSMSIRAVGPADVGWTQGLLDESDIYYFTPAKGVCYGDFGGPAFLIRNGVERVAAVTSSGSTLKCTGDGVSARVDQPEIDSFLQAAIDDLEANDPCRADGVCNDSCNTDQIVDPDCAEQHCGKDGVCATACVAPPDPDCASQAAEDPAAGGCAVAPGSPSPAWLVLLGVLLARRRSRRPSGG